MNAKHTPTAAEAFNATRAYAPDMLATLKAIHMRAAAANGEWDSFADLLRDLRHIEAMASLAISKAEGEHQ